MSELPRSIGEAIRSLRLESGLTEEDLATDMGKSQSFIPEVEDGQCSIKVEDLEKFAEALGCNVTTILNRMSGLDSILDRWNLSEAEFTELIDSNPSLRGMVLGYAAEVKFRHMYLVPRDDITSIKDDDHDRKKKGDRRLTYKKREIVVEVKSLQTNKCKHDPVTNTWSGKSQVDGSDRRIVHFDDGTELNTTLLLRGEFDILAVNCFAFGGTWRFAFALNKDLATSTYSKYTDEQRSQLIASLQTVTWPPKPPFTSDFDEILEQAWNANQPGPEVEGIEENPGS